MKEYYIYTRLNYEWQFRPNPNLDHTLKGATEQTLCWTQKPTARRVIWNEGCHYGGRKRDPFEPVNRPSPKAYGAAFRSAVHGIHY